VNKEWNMQIWPSSEEKVDEFRMKAIDKSF